MFGLCHILQLFYIWYITGPLDFGASILSHESSHSSASSIPHHPDVIFKVLPFYDLITELMKPTSLGNIYNDLNRVTLKIHMGSDFFCPEFCI